MHVPIGCVRFARYCGKMYSHDLFRYSGFNANTGNINLHYNRRQARENEQDTIGKFRYIKILLQFYSSLSLDWL